MGKRIASNATRLLEWIKTNAYVERDEGQFVKIIVRSVVNKSKVGDELSRFPVPQGKERDDSWDVELAHNILSSLELEATQLGGMQHFACYSVFSDHDGTVNRCLLSIQGSVEDDNDDDGLLAEPPTKSGITAQAMRHQETTMKIMATTIGASLESLRRLNDRVMQLNERLMGNMAELVKERMEIAAQVSESRAAEAQQQIKADAVKAGMQTLQKMVPHVINQLTGKEIIPSGETPNEAQSAAKALFPTLTEDQYEALHKILKPEQVQHLMSMGQALLPDE